MAAKKGDPRNEEQWMLFLRLRVDSARSGRQEARDAIRNILEHQPEIREKVGNLARCAQRAWLDVLATRDPILAEAIPLTSNQMKQDWAGQGATPLERMIVERIFTDWLQLHVLEMRYQLNVERRIQDDQVAAQFDVAHRRFLASIKTLALVKKWLPSGGSESASQPAVFVPKADAEPDWPEEKATSTMNGEADCSLRTATGQTQTNGRRPRLKSRANQPVLSTAET